MSDKPSTPLKPRIYTRMMKPFSVCNCCGNEDGTIKQLVLGWEEHSGIRHGGSSSVSLCRSCRVSVRDLLDDELNGRGDGE